MDFQKLAHIRNTSNPYAKQLGILVEEISQGYARVVKTVRPEDLNPVGVPHGGVYFSMADTACGSAMSSYGNLALTVNANYNYLRSGKVGETLTAEAWEVKPGRSLSVFDVRITGQDGKLLGTGTFTFYKLEQKIEV